MSRLKKKESEFVAQITTMITNMNAGILTPSGVTPTQWEAVENALPVLVTKINDAVAARTAAKTATTTKDTQEQLLRTLVQGFVDRFYAVPTITDQQLESIGLPPRNAGSRPLPPRVVTNLVAKILVSGAVRLNWRPNGNTRNTLYEIQADTGTGFVTIATSVGSRFTDNTTPIGLPRTYRIVAVNTLGRALPSNAVVVYGEAEGDALSVAA